MAHKAYVAGFMFDAHDNVAVVKKINPPWQRGKFNGIGGKVEATDENPHIAMVREFFEETGAVTNVREWKLFCSLYGDDGEDFVVHFFSTHFVEMPTLTTVEAEEIHVLPTSSLTLENALPNLQWLIPMAKSMVKDTVESFEVHERHALPAWEGGL